MRPENVLVRPAGAGHIAGEVELVESLGADTLIYANVGADGTHADDAATICSARAGSGITNGSTSAAAVDARVAARLFAADRAAAASACRDATRAGWTEGSLRSAATLPSTWIPRPTGTIFWQAIKMTNVREVALR